MVAQLSEITDKIFDYVIIGAGAAGLAVAARLAEDPTVSVALLEAGEPNLDDPKILLGGGFGSTWGDPKYDWDFKTVPQKYSANREWPWNRGKGLGGSSAMNFYAWIKPPAADVDAIGELGNPGWNWESYRKYTLRAEHFTEATEDQLKEFAHTHNKEFRGTGGPIETTVPGTSHLTDRMFMDTMLKKGIQVVEDPYGGDITGSFTVSACLDRMANWTRSYATTAYYLPHKDKPNFKVLTDATVVRVLFVEERDGNDLIATGVEFIYSGEPHVVRAKKEVVVSAGAIKSPQILELSGIGQPEILKKIGVPLQLELPGVGENVQDHTFGGVSYELDPNVNHETFDGFRDPEFAKEQTRLQSLGSKNRHRFGISAFSYIPLSTADIEVASSFASRVSAWVEKQKKSGKLPPGLVEQYDLQVRTLNDDSLPDMEFIAFPGWMTFISKPEPGKSYLTLLYVLNHPFSRGTIHARSNNPLDQPDIDPHTFEIPFDIELLMEHVKFVRKLVQAEPLKSGIVREVDPGPSTKTDEEIKDYIEKTSSTTFHAIGSLSMLPREKHGVVDAQLKVYGTKNLRIADLSIVPIHIAAHTQATAYAIGEKLADILKGVL